MMLPPPNLMQASLPAPETNSSPKRGLDSSRSTFTDALRSAGDDRSIRNREQREPISGDSDEHSADTAADHADSVAGSPSEPGHTDEPEPVTSDHGHGAADDDGLNDEAAGAPSATGSEPGAQESSDAAQNATVQGEASAHNARAAAALVNYGDAAAGAQVIQLVAERQAVAKVSQNDSKSSTTDQTSRAGGGVDQSHATKAASVVGAGSEADDVQQVWSQAQAAARMTRDATTGDRTAQQVTSGAIEETAKNAAAHRAAPSNRVEVQPSAPVRDAVHPAMMRTAEVETRIRVEQSTGTAPTISIDAGNSAGKVMTASAAASALTAGADAPSDGQRLDQPQMTQRVLKGLTAMLNQRGGTMTMRLDPPDLGSLRIQMTMARGVVAAEFHASTPLAQQAIEQSMATLRTALEAQGLTVERLHVHQGTMHQHAGADQQQSQPDAGDGQSRGRSDDQAHANRQPSGDALFDSIFEELQTGDAPVAMRASGAAA